MKPCKANISTQLAALSPCKGVASVESEAEPVSPAAAHSTSPSSTQIQTSCGHLTAHRVSSALDTLWGGKRLWRTLSASGILRHDPKWHTIATTTHLTSNMELTKGKMGELSSHTQILGPAHFNLRVIQPRTQVKPIRSSTLH